MNKNEPTQKELLEVLHSLQLTEARDCHPFALKEVILNPQRQEAYLDALKKLNKKFLGPLNQYYKDRTVTFERLKKPVNLQRDTDCQAKAIQHYFPTATIVPESIDVTSSPPSGFCWAVTLKISYLQRLFHLKNGYSQIGIPILEICNQIKTKREGRFNIGCLETLKSGNVSFDPEAADHRIKMEESIAGDVFAYPLDITNTALGDNGQTHTTRWSRAELLLRGKQLFAPSAVEIGLYTLVGMYNGDIFDSGCPYIDAAAEMVTGSEQTLFFGHDRSGLELGLHTRSDKTPSSDHTAAVGVIPGKRYDPWDKYK